MKYTQSVGTLLKSVLAVIVVISLGLGLVACGGSGSSAGASGSNREFQITVPSDTTNEARALLLLQAEGLITLKEGVGLAATPNDIVENPYNIKIVEAEAAAVSRTLPDVDMAVINGNYALEAELDLASALASEDATSDAANEFANIVAVRAEDTGSEKTKVLVEALQSEEVKSFIEGEYNGAVIPVDIPATTTSGGSDATDTVIRVGASPAPHAEILEVARPLIEAQGFTLEIVEFTDYIQPNVALTDGSLDANYFQHLPYLEDYNAENGTTLASVLKVHFEPLSLYAGKTLSIKDITG